MRVWRARSERGGEVREEGTSRECEERKGREEEEEEERKRKERGLWREEARKERRSERTWSEGEAVERSGEASEGRERGVGGRWVLEREGR